MTAPGDLVAWRRVHTKGQRSEEQQGYAVVCEVGRGYASLWPVSGPVTRRLQVTLDDCRVLVPSAELLTVLDQRAAQ